MFTTDIYTAEIRYTAIRNLSGNIQEQTKSDLEINDIASRKDSRIFNLTNKTNWTDADPQTPDVIDASNSLAAAEILAGIGTIPNQQLAEMLIKKAKSIIKIINGDSPLQESEPPVFTSGINGPQRGTVI